MKMSKRDIGILAALVGFLALFWAAVWIGAWAPDSELIELGGSRVAGALLLTVLMVVLTAIYLIPTALAFYREHPNAVAIAVVNVILGLAFGVGWLAALVWTLVSRNVRKERITEEKRAASAALARPQGRQPITFQE
ncbi:MAG: superinfection immunity protein [Chloroflexi bacterium]|nr:superinfection immunity protein [Chloroflexota bacterium]